MKLSVKGPVFGSIVAGYQAKHNFFQKGVGQGYLIFKALSELFSEKTCCALGHFIKLG